MGLDLNMELVPRLLHLDFSVGTVDVSSRLAPILSGRQLPLPILSARGVSTAYLNHDVGCVMVVGVDN
jgi:hypothetical protein